VQAKVLPVAQDYNAYASEVASELSGRRVRVEVDDRGEKLGFKIREAETMKIPYMLIVGAKEAGSGRVSVRSRGRGDMGSMPLSDFAAMIEEEIRARRIG